MVAAVREGRGTGSGPSGLADRLPPEVAAGLGAISRVAKALNGPGSLEELTARALAELSAALSLVASALYLPAPGPPPMLRLYLEAEPPPDAPHAHEELVFDAEAWRLAFASGRPVVFHEPASWLVANPFDPEAHFWLALPMVASGELVGVVMAARGEPFELDPVALTVLTLLGEQLSAGIATARLRRELQRAELDRERIRLAADVHDGLAQDLALAVRELALLESELPEEDARASMERLSGAVTAAHRIVRARLVDLSASVPLGGLGAAVEEVCERFRRRGLPVSVEVRGGDVTPEPEVATTVLRVAHEALANAARHAHARSVEVRLAVGDARLELTVSDDGRGFDLAPGERPGGGHLGLGIMRQRAEQARGLLEIASEPGAGTRVTLVLAAGAGDPWRGDRASA